MTPSVGDQTGVVCGGPSNTPWLSVIIPTYNGAAFLEQTLESIHIQADSGVECLLIDDGSSDSTIAIASAYSTKLNLNLIAGKRRGSWVAGTNDGLRLARGIYACFLHQDDIWLPGRLARMRPLIEAYPQCAVFFHAVYFTDDKGRRLGQWRCPLPSKTPLEGDYVTARLLVQCFTAINGPIFRRDLALKIGGLNQKLWYTADWDFWLRLVANQRVAYCPDALAAFRLHATSLTVVGSGNSTDFEDQLSSVLERHLQAIEAPDDVISRARLSVRFNAAMARAYGRKGYGPLLAAAWYLFWKGPFYWCRFLRDTRIHERVGARINALLRGSM